MKTNGSRALLSLEVLQGTHTQHTVFTEAKPQHVAWNAADPQQCPLVSLAAPLQRRTLDSESWGQALHQLPLA